MSILVDHFVLLGRKEIVEEMKERDRGERGQDQLLDRIAHLNLHLSIK